MRQSLIGGVEICWDVSFGAEIDPKSPEFPGSGVCFGYGGRGLDPNETLSHSYGRLLFDHGPCSIHIKIQLRSYSYG